MTEVEIAEKFYKEYPDTAFEVAMGKSALSLGLSAAIYARVCDEVEKTNDIELIAQLMNSMDNFEISAEAIKLGYRHKDGAVELGKEVKLARVEAFEKAHNRKSLTQRFSDAIKGFRK